MPAPNAALPGEATPLPHNEIETVLELVQLGCWDWVLDWCGDLAFGSLEFAAYAQQVSD